MKIKACVGYNDEDVKTYYYKHFEIIDKLPEDEFNEYKIIRIESVDLDPEQPNSNVYDYEYYYIVVNYDDSEDYYPVAVKIEEEEE